MCDIRVCTAYDARYTFTNGVWKPRRTHDQGGNNYIRTDVFYKASVGIQKQSGNDDRRSKRTIRNWRKQRKHGTRRRHHARDLTVADERKHAPATKPLNMQLGEEIGSFIRRSISPISAGPWSVTERFAYALTACKYCHHNKQTNKQTFTKR